MKIILWMTLIFSLAIHCWGVTQTTLLHKHDEILYLQPELLAMYAPLFKLWYKFISLFAGRSPISTYYLGHFTIAIICIALSAIVAIRLRAAPWAVALLCAFPVAWISWVTHSNYVQHFNLAVSLAALLACSYSLEKDRAYLFLANSFLILCYSRQENLIFAVCFYALWLYTKLRSRPPLSRQLIDKASLRAHAIFLITCVGFFVFNPFGESRQSIAFAYSLHFTLEIEPSLVNSLMGNPPSTLTFIQNNPGIFLRYTLANLQGLFFREEMPYSQFNGWFMFVLLAVSCLLVGFRSRVFKIQDRANPSEPFAGVFLSFFGISLLKSVIIVAMFGPAWRFIFDTIFAAAILIAARAGRHKIEFVPETLLYITVISCLALCTFLPKKKSTIKFQFSDVVRRLEQSMPPGRINIMADEPYVFYLRGQQLESLAERSRSARPCEIISDYVILDWVANSNQELKIIDACLQMPNSCYEPVLKHTQVQAYRRKNGC